MIKVKMIVKMAGERFYDIHQVVELDEITAASWVQHNVAIYVDDVHSVAKKVERPEELNPVAEKDTSEPKKPKIEIIDVNHSTAKETLTTQKAVSIRKPGKPTVKKNGKKK